MNDWGQLLRNAIYHFRYALVLGMVVLIVGAAYWYEAGRRNAVINAELQERASQQAAIEKTQVDAAKAREVEAEREVARKQAEEAEAARREARARLDQQQQAEQQFRQRYVFPGRHLASEGWAVAVAGPAGNLDDVFAGEVARALSSGARPTGLIFPQALAADGYLKELLGSGQKLAQRLKLGEACRYLLLGTYTTEITKDPALENVMSARVTLNGTLFQCSSWEQVDFVSVEAPGAGFSVETSTAQARAQIAKALAGRRWVTAGEK